MRKLKTAPLSLEDIASYLNAELVGDAKKTILGLSPLATASPNHLSFLANPKYLHDLKATSAGGVILSPENLSSCPCDALLMDDPYWGYARVSQLFRATQRYSGVHPSAVVADSASIPSSASVAPGAIIEEGAVLGEDVTIGAGCVLGRNVQLDDGCYLHANVTLYHDVKIGAHSIVHSGAVIGADGFGFAPHKGSWEKIEQLGSVRIGKSVEIGANTTIDRGAMEDTIIGNGVILDNQIQIAHNVIIGDGTAIAAGTAIAGSTKIGSYCTIAGAVAIAGHITITDKVHVKGRSLVSKDISKAGVYASGTGGVMENHNWQKNAARFRKLNDLAIRVQALEKYLPKAGD